MNVNKEVLRIALPAVASNITVPLLGICDTMISGHLGSADFLGAIAVGTMAVNAVFWCLGFLRGGTTGLTAQALGRKDENAIKMLFTRATLLGLALGLLIILLQTPLLNLILAIIAPEAVVATEAATYYKIVTYSAPAMLATMAISGWFLGMQTSVQPMIIAITTNIINIAASIFCAYGLGMGFAGTATGTLIANWSGLLLALWLVWRFRGKRLPLAPARQVFKSAGWGRFFNVNVFIFLRSFCIMAVTMGVTSMGARLGTDILAANTIIMQFFMVFSYFMDGFAYAAEALTGRAAGAKDRTAMHRNILAILRWGAGITIAFTAVYTLLNWPISSLFTDDAHVLGIIHSLQLWIILAPVCGAAAFIFDGVYIGLTATRQMLFSTLLGLVLFNLCARLMPLPGADKLWLAFMIYLLARGIYLGALYNKESRKIC